MKNRKQKPQKPPRGRSILVDFDIAADALLEAQRRMVGLDRTAFVRSIVVRALREVAQREMAA